MVLLAIISFLSVTYDAGLNSTGTINYYPGQQLKWSDFRVVKYLGDASAESTTGISYDYLKVGNETKVNVYCTFSKKESFVLKGKETDYILNHEQRHFDITFIFAMKFKDQISRTNDLSESDIELIYNRIIIEWGIFQDKYDFETEHSINISAQDIWDKKINGHLEKSNKIFIFNH